MDTKSIVRRFVDEAVNGGREELIDELFTSDVTGWVRDWFGAFRRSFPDLHMRTVTLVAEGDSSGSNPAARDRRGFVPYLS